jgi:hypothetical protein
VVQRGGSVLVATQSPHAADVLAGLLARYGGPDPVLFGDGERRTALAAGLAAGQEAGVPERDLRADRAAVDHDFDRVREARGTVLAALELEEHAPGEHLRPGSRDGAGDLAGRAPPQRAASDRLLGAASTTTASP